ncbi:hypothetical protein [Cellulomonas sp. HZM]|uniref:hypothetical protein n=1 Tax=Cellulomonas sp. HZM TaxID=1454010 RepID=UPI0009E0589D|nr:hypothetical protein [Cellulomonas sp. HZM]
MRAWFARLDARLTARGSAHRLVEVQTLVALVIGYRLLVRDWTHISDRPADLWDGLTVMSWWPGVPPAWLVVTLQVAGVLGVLLVVLRVRTRAAFVVAWVCYVVLCAWWGSSGKVMHNDVLTVTVASVLLFASPPRRGEHGRTVRWGWPPRGALMVLGFVYFLTGFQKLRHSGLHWVFSDNMVWILRQGAAPRAHDLAMWVADHPWIAQGLAGGALALELTAPVWIAFRLTRGWFALAVAVMHGSIWLLLGIDYSAWILTAAAVCVPMALAPDRGLFARLAGRRRAAVGHGPQAEQEAAAV